MENRWLEEEAAGLSDLNLLVYQSRLIGAEAALVIRGGGNTSLKVSRTDFRDRETKAMLIKGSGSDMKTVWPPDFPAVRLDDVLPLFERAEMSIKVRESGEGEVRVLQRPDTAREMVAELMILCNSLLAEFCKQHELPAPYRSQKAPDLDDAITQAPEGPLRWYLTIRKMSPASISTESSTHGGLGAKAYIQASSPLRRYPDLVVQRQISHYVETGQQLYSKEAIASVAQRAEVQLREIGRLEDERKKYWFLKYLDERRQASQNGDGESLYDAIVLDAPPNRAGLLELVQYPFRVRAAFPSTVSPGETVCLRLHGVDLWRRVGQFVVAQ